MDGEALVRPRLDLDGVDLDAVLGEAHIPSLMVALVHLTGNTDHLTEARRPVYEVLGDGQGGLKPEDVQAIRDLAKQALGDLAAGKPLPPSPTPAQVRFMMDYVAGAEIPERYAPFLTEALSLDGVDPDRPTWNADEKQAAAGLKVIVIGAGMSGLLTGIRLQQAGIGFTILDKNPDVGGTWLENSYPGCRVDTPNHLYSLSFEPNHDWPQRYSTQDVLLRYFQRLADKYGLREHIRFGTRVEAAVFDEASATWSVKVEGPDGPETLTANAVISAVGQLNQPNFPEIPGRELFAGPSFHSARWDHAVDLKGKRVAVIGTGASAFQFVPKIAAEAGELTVFQRSPPWLAPTEDYHETVGEGKKWLLEHLPFYDKWYRFYLFWTMTDGVYEAVKADPDWVGPAGTISEASAMLREMLVAKIGEQTAGDAALLEAVTPQYPFGGKRALRDNGVWIEALKRPNVTLVTQPVTAVTPAGVVTADGAEHPADVLIYGTGFKASSFLTPMTVVGRGGKDLHQAWGGDARAYLGMTAPGFPNFFMLYGPNTNIVVNGSIIFFSEASVRYVVEALRLMVDSGAKTVEVRPEVHDAFNARVDEANAHMAWGVEGVSSWYKNAHGRVSQNWPFPLVEYWEATRAPDPGDFVIAK
jgi:4-hydroxyacetophenone monooxygenase